MAGVRQRFSAPRKGPPSEAVAISRPVTEVVELIDMSGSMRDHFHAIRRARDEALAFFKSDPAVSSSLRLALGVMSGPAAVGEFDWVDRVAEPPYTPGQWSEIGGLARSVAEAFLKVEAADRAAGVIVRKRYAFLVTDGVPSDEPAADTAAGIAALADVARTLGVVVQVIGVPNSDADNLAALSHGTTPIRLADFDVATLYGWLREAIRSVSVRRPGATDLGKPANAVAE